MPSMGAQRSLAFGGSRHSALVTWNTATAGAKVRFWQWDGNERRFVRTDTDLADCKVEMVFRGQERHLRLNVPGWPKAWDALCGQNVSHWRHTVSLGDEREGERLLTVCGECLRTFDDLT